MPLPKLVVLVSVVMAAAGCAADQPVQSTQAPKLPAQRLARPTGGMKAGTCVMGHMTPEALAAAKRLRTPVTVLFTVEADGNVTGYKMLIRDVPQVVTDGIEAALKACPWEPTLDMEGNPVSSEMLLPMRFQ